MDDFDRTKPLIQNGFPRSFASREEMRDLYSDGTVQRLREGSVSVVCNCFLSGGCFWLLDSFLCPTLVMSDYDIRPGGSLKLKGGVTEGGIVKK